MSVIYQFKKGFFIFVNLYTLKIVVKCTVAVK